MGLKCRLLFGDEYGMDRPDNALAALGVVGAIMHVYYGQVMDMSAMSLSLTTSLPSSSHLYPLFHVSIHPVCLFQMYVLDPVPLRFYLLSLVLEDACILYMLEDF